MSLTCRRNAILNLNFSGDNAEPPVGFFSLPGGQEISSTEVQASNHQDTVWEFSMYAFQGRQSCYIEGRREDVFKTTQQDHINEINIEIRENPGGGAQNRYKCVVLSPWEHHHHH